MPYQLRTARKEHACTERRCHTIRVGDRYLFGACPPWHEANGSRRWWIVKACPRCARELALGTEAQRADLNGEKE